MFRFWFSSRGRAGRRGRGLASRSPHAIMSISRRAPRSDSDGAQLSRSSLSSAAAESRAQLAAEYLARTERLCSRLRPQPHPRLRPQPAALPDYRLAYESPQNLALELTKSILYETADSIDVAALKSVGSGDSLWNGRPQQYFESMNYADYEGPVKKSDCDMDSLAP